MRNRKNNRRFRYRSNGRNYQGRLNGDDKPRIGSSSFLNGRPRNNFKPQQSADKLAEKYNTLAKEALASGDKILSENYFQHAEHFMRIVSFKNLNQNKSSLDEKNLNQNKSSLDEQTQTNDPALDKSNKVQVSEEEKK